MLRMTVNITQKPMLVMTPKLQQAIKILQMHRLELAQYINQQMEQNPVLEFADTIEEADEISEDTDEVDKLNTEISEANLDVDTGLPDDDVNSLASKDDSPELDVTSDEFGDFDWERYFEDTFPVTKNEWEAPSEDDLRDNTITEQESLDEHLLWQLRMAVESEKDYTIGEAIIGNIDEDGYLMATLEEIAQNTETEIAEVERLLKVIQVFDPIGVGSRNLKECLLIQLQQLGLKDTIAYEIVEKNLLEFLESNRIPQLAKELGVEMDIVQAAAKVISNLEPRPGRQFSSERSEVIVPDVTVEKVDDKYSVFVNDSGPGLRVSPYYRSLLSKKNSLPSEAREYIRDNIQSAAWLLMNIERRYSTIQRVTESIFEEQKDFLDKGPSYLKPLTLKDIAAKLGNHESTISRVTTNRYVQTPWGVYELKKFFTSGISTKDGGMTSSTSVKEAIKEIVDNENPKKPLNDDEIVQKLSGKGIKIARRTVNKYRSELDIPSASKRKKW